MTSRSDKQDARDFLAAKVAERDHSYKEGKRQGLREAQSMAEDRARGLPEQGRRLMLDLAKDIRQKIERLI